jgi:PhnB protein
MAVKPIPDKYHAVTPYLVCNGAAAAIEFYKRAFGATERTRFEMGPGKIGHAEIQIGDSAVMLSDEFTEMGYAAPQGSISSSIYLYVNDVDTTFKNAIAAGAKELRPIKDEFYGDRSGTLRDPFGHVWSIATHKEDLTPEELKRRGEEMMKEFANKQ